MSIFDGHEDKSPKELAKELGISESSIVNTAEKEIIDTIEKKVTHKVDNRYGGKTNISSKIVKNNDLWTNTMSIHKLEAGMIFKKNNTQTIGKITAVDIKGTIFIQQNGMDEVSSWSFDKFTKEFKVLISSIENNISFLDDKYLNHHDARIYWTDKYSYENVEIGNRVRKEIKGGEKYKDGVITEVVAKMITIKYSNHKTETTLYHDFKRKFDIFKQSLVTNYYEADLKHIIPGTRNYSLSDLRIGSQMVDNKTNNWYYIIDIYEQKAHPHNLDDYDCTVIEIWNESDDYKSCEFDSDFVSQYTLYDNRNAE